MHGGGGGGLQQRASIRPLQKAGERSSDGSAAPSSARRTNLVGRGIADSQRDATDGLSRVARFGGGGGPRLPRVYQRGSTAEKDRIDGTTESKAAAAPAVGVEPCGGDGRRPYDLRTLRLAGPSPIIKAHDKRDPPVGGRRGLIPLFLSGRHQGGRCRIGAFGGGIAAVREREEVWVRPLWAEVLAAGLGPTHEWRGGGGGGGSGGDDARGAAGEEELGRRAPRPARAGAPGCACSP